MGLVGTNPDPDPVPDPDPGFDDQNLKKMSSQEEVHCPHTLMVTQGVYSRKSTKQNEWGPQCCGTVTIFYGSGSDF